jgi:myo-inositol-1(or 4)-monophosphatase
MPAIPSHADLTHFMSTVQQIVVGADQILLQAFGTVSASRKADGTLVTQADNAVDEFITKQIKSAFPDHAVLSEERNTTYNPAFDFTWVIDPLDGTTNFARGLPIWGVSVALLYLGSPVLGLLSFPSLREIYTAIVHQGAFLNNHPLTTATNQTVDDQHFMMMCTRTPLRYRIDTPLKPRILGSAAYHLVSVANGSALAAIEATPKLWDIAAVLLILTEAGGCYQSLDKQTLIFPLEPTLANYERTSYPLLAAANQTILDDLLLRIERNS